MLLPVVALLAQKEMDQQLLLMRKLLLSSKPMALKQYVVFAIARAQLAANNGGGDKPGKVIRHRRLQPLIADVMVVAALMARTGHGEVAVAQRAFTAAMARVGVANAQLPTPTATTVAALEKSLRRLRGLALMSKMKLISALATAVLYDQQVRVEELELLRAICEILDCPLPPLQVAA